MTGPPHVTRLGAAGWRGPDWRSADAAQTYSKSI